MPDKKEEKSWIRRHWILSIIFGIFGILILLGIIGSISNNLAGNNENSLQGSNNSKVIAEEYPCPNLSSMSLNDYDTYVDSWSAKVSPYKTSNLEIVYTYSIFDEGNNKIYCDAGSEEGQNANWVYCGDFSRPILAQYTDNNGTIVKIKTMQVTFDKNTKQYLATECNVYTSYYS